MFKIIFYENLESSGESKKDQNNPNTLKKILTSSGNSKKS